MKEKKKTRTFIELSTFNSRREFNLLLYYSLETFKFKTLRLITVNSPVRMWRNFSFRFCFRIQRDTNERMKMVLARWCSNFRRGTLIHFTLFFRASTGSLTRSAFFFHNLNEVYHVLHDFLLMSCLPNNCKPNVFHCLRNRHKLFTAARDKRKFFISMEDENNTLNLI